MKKFPAFRLLVSLSLLATMVLMPLGTVRAQDPVTGAIEGYVFDSASKAPISGALVQFINTESGAVLSKRTNEQGYYRQGLLPPGEYRIRVSMKGYANPPDQLFTNYATRPNSVRPPFLLTAEGAAVATATPGPTPTAGQPAASPTPVAQATTLPPTTVTAAATKENMASEMNMADARHSGAFTDKEVSTLPLGGTTLTRSFDELALLWPGVAPPPQTLGSVAGPGVGAGVGSAGQFAVNGMRSRSNNFTVDGSDNNDEDIGVRRQGFFALVPQPIESVKEFQIITLLAPAQYGRSFGGQVNVLSKSGGNQFHGTLYGFFNSSQLNSRNFFDTANGNGTTALRSSTGQAVLDCTGVSDAACITRNRSLTTTNQSGGEDSFTLGQGGFVLGGPIKRDKAFFFVSYETQVLNATKEASFAVPTVDRRGIFNTGATGVFADCLTPFDPGFNITNCTPANSAHFFPEFGFPSALQGDDVFSLFPFPNNPTGVYGANTFTEILPASARGNIASGKYDQNFKLWGKPQTFTARYNFTQDWRDIPVTGGALFSSLRPRVRTQNFSTFLTSALTNSMSNVLRLSYGRTRLAFDELRDPSLIPSRLSPSEPFLLNAPRLENDTLNPSPIVVGGFFVGVPNTGPVLYRLSGTTECGLSVSCTSGSGFGRVGQINIAGFSPMGVDVNFFPQQRVNNTYQLADTVGYRTGNHSLAFGEDIRRVELNSDLPRNSRTLLTYNGAPEANQDPVTGLFKRFTGNFIPGIDFAAAGAPSGAFLSLARTGSAIGLRYYEYDFFGQDEWRIRRNLSVNFGLRYENNTPPREVHNLIERTFTDPLLNDPNAAGLKTFVAGRTQIFDPDHNNFEPRVGLAWSPNWFGPDRSSVIRAGFGVFHDQILGAVVSQSRNVYPNFVTVNTGGFGGSGGADFLSFFNPARGGILSGGIFTPLVQPGTLSTFNPSLTVPQVLNVFASGINFPNSVSITLPDRFIKTPSDEQYSVTFEQQLNANTLLSVAYVGTRGHNLLRASTPNLGPSNLILPFSVFAGVDDSNCFPVITQFCPSSSLVPSFFGFVGAPGNVAAAIAAQNPTLTRRPTTNAGPVYIFESGGSSQYDALQVQLRGRSTRGLQYQANYTFSSAKDNASDVFDLAGAPALPQDSLTRAGELGQSNFDARHRFAYDVIYDLPKNSNASGLYKAVFNGLQFASTGSFQTGQPFTVNSIFDVNGDGNLTDRLNTTQGIVITGDRRQPIALQPGTNTRSLLAALGQDGAVGRNSFRSGNILNLDLAVVKNFPLSETRRIVFRMDIFNFINRANFGVPVRYLEAPSFGQATSTITPGRRIQFGLKFSF